MQAQKPQHHPPRNVSEEQAVDEFSRFVGIFEDVDPKQDQQGGGEENNRSGADADPGGELRRDSKRREGLNHLQRSHQQEDVGQPEPRAQPKGEQQEAGDDGRLGQGDRELRQVEGIQGMSPQERK